MRDEHDGTAYLGYDFQCRWDPSGIVVLMHLLDHASATQRVLLGAIARAHPDVPRRHLEDHVQLLSAHVQAAPADKVAYVGYQLACDWEEEHGLGVLLHGDRVVEVGQADTAFLGWNADRDRVKRRTSRPQRVRS